MVILEYGPCSCQIAGRQLGNEPRTFSVIVPCPLGQSVERSSKIKHEPLLKQVQPHLVYVLPAPSPRHAIQDPMFEDHSAREGIVCVQIHCDDPQLATVCRPGASPEDLPPTVPSSRWSWLPSHLCTLPQQHDDEPTQVADQIRVSHFELVRPAPEQELLIYHVGKRLVGGVAVIGGSD